MTYVDGFVIPVPKKNLAAYRKLARKAAKVWMDHGALQLCETAGDDMSVPCGPGFPKGIGAKSGEIVIFSWITYKSRAHRDRVNKKVMEDPRIAAMGSKMPFDSNRMLYAGFKAIVEG